MIAKQREKYTPFSLLSASLISTSHWLHPAQQQLTKVSGKKRPMGQPLWIAKQKRGGVRNKSEGKHAKDNVLLITRTIWSLINKINRMNIHACHFTSNKIWNLYQIILEFSSSLKNVCLYMCSCCMVSIG